MANRHRWRRSRRSCSFVLLFFAFLATIVWLLQLVFLSSFLDLDNGQSLHSTGDGKSEPIWKSCPSKHLTSEASGDICFVTCIFGEKVRDVDHPANVEWFRNHWCHTRFWLVTNLPGLPAPGWTTIVSPMANDRSVRNATTTATTTTTATATATATIPSTTSDNHSDNGNDRHAATATTKTHIVQSRHAKFLAWDALDDMAPKHCAAVVYMDGYLIPKRYTSWRSVWVSLLGSSPWSPSSPLFGWVPRLFPRLPPDGGQRQHQPQIPPPAKFQEIVRQVRTHPWGLSQVKQKYFDGLPMTTLLNNLVRDRKDTQENVQNTLKWFRSHTTDFSEIMPYYLNKYFAYDPNNARYRELSSYFWKTYTTYGGLWRDQPLWAYVLHHFNVTPAVMTTEGTITKGGDLFKTGGTMGWGKHVYV
eukprot:jgi/Psemu1/282774/fgenesh1_pg.13_\